jgi:hypothetical protein
MAPFGDTRIVLPDVPFAMAFSIFDHAAEFEDLERLAISANPFAPEKDAAFRSANGDEGQNQKKGRKNQLIPKTIKECRRIASWVTWLRHRSGGWNQQ